MVWVHLPDAGHTTSLTDCEDEDEASIAAADDEDGEDDEAEARSNGDPFFLPSLVLQHPAGFLRLLWRRRRR
jgi:hypothetical protein